MPLEPSLAQWAQLFPGGPVEIVEAIFDRIRDHYQEPIRRYHGWQHPAIMLELMGLYFPNASPELAMGIFLHDAIYDPVNGGGGKNEGDSAEFGALIMERLGCSATVIKDVAESVRCTFDHVSCSRLSAQLCDLDLLSLAAPPHVYRANTAKIRVEYQHATDDQWLRGREEFIGRFLGRDYIFVDPTIERENGHRARINLETELILLLQSAS
jgi:predicted metal-dependent HD superfamily phosphohydrolase